MRIWRRDEVSKTFAIFMFLFFGSLPSSLLVRSAFLLATSVSCLSWLWTGLFPKAQPSQRMRRFRFFVLSVHRAPTPPCTDPTVHRPHRPVRPVTRGLGRGPADVSDVQFGRRTGQRPCSCPSLNGLASMRSQPTWSHMPEGGSMQKPSQTGQ